MAKPLDINRKIDCRLFQLLVDIEVSQVFTHIIFWIVHPTYVTLAHTLVFGCRLCCFMTHPMKHYSNVPIINLIMLFGSIIFLLSLSLSHTVFFVALFSLSSSHMYKLARLVFLPIYLTPMKICFSRYLCGISRRCFHSDGAFNLITYSVFVSKRISDIFIIFCSFFVCFSILYSVRITIFHNWIGRVDILTIYSVRNSVARCGKRLIFRMLSIPISLSIHSSHIFSTNRRNSCRDSIFSRL